MNYGLAKKLKDAGFPQGGKVRPTECAGWGGGDSDVINPTLEELIDACGDDFRLLELVSGKRWECVGVDEFFDTPTEAVAMLYLALNK